MDKKTYANIKTALISGYVMCILLLLLGVLISYNVFIISAIVGAVIAFIIDIAVTNKHKETINNNTVDDITEQTVVSAQMSKKQVDNSTSYHTPIESEGLESTTKMQKDAADYTSPITREVVSGAPIIKPFELPEMVGENNLYKRFNQSVCFIRNSGIKARDYKEKINELIKFQQEPENEFDNRAVAVYLDGARIGYVYRGETQDLINESLDKKYPVVGYIREYFQSFDGDKLYYTVGIYRPSDCFESKEYKLKSIRKSALLDCEEGEELYPVYDDEREEFIIENSVGEKVGALPKRVQSEINKTEDFYVVLKELDEDEGSFAIVTVYY